MTDSEFDTALVGAALAIAAEDGWRRVTVTAASRAAGLALDRARVRFPSRNMILFRFGALADQAALADAPAEGPVRDRLFDVLMRRIDAFQAHRDGVVAVLRALPFDPPLALMLACATERSMRWMLESSGVTLTGPRGDLTVKGCVAIWLWTLRAWERDGSADLSGTMSALDTALQRAEQAAGWLGAQEHPAVPEESPVSEPDPLMPEDAAPSDPTGYETPGVRASEPGEEP